MDTEIAALVGALTQLGLAAAAWRLASALKIKVTDHDEKLDDHGNRLVKLETRTV